MVIPEIKVELEWFAVVTVIVAFVVVGISTIESNVVCWIDSDVVAAGVVVFVKVFVVVVDVVVVFVVTLGWGKFVELVVVVVVVATVVVVVVEVVIVVVVVVVVVVDVTKIYLSFVNLA